MQIVEASLRDGLGLVSLAVVDVMTRDRVRKYFKDMEKTMDKASELEDQRDELLAALRGMLALDQDDHQRGGDDEDVCEEVKATQVAVDRALGA